MRIVLDTSVLIAALRSGHGASARVLEEIFRGKLIPCMDLKLAYEYRDVSQRPYQIAAQDGSTVDSEKLIQRIERAAEAINVLVRHRPLSPDPSDDLVMDIAINGRVDAIVTHNLRHFHRPALRFGIECFTPADILKELSRRASWKT